MSLNKDALSTIRHDWTQEEALQLFALPFTELLFQAQQVHHRFFPEGEVQLSTLLSIKTGGCAEDCKYCPQSAHYNTGVKASKLLGGDVVVEAATRAKAQGATRFCMGAAWRELKDRDVPKLCDMIRDVKGLGLETCMTLGMMTEKQAGELKKAGLDFYNHNIDTSEAFYNDIITTRSYAERLETLQHVRSAGMKVCCGGIIGMGEAAEDRAAMLCELANLTEQPESVPINLLVRVAGTPLEEGNAVDIFDFIRSIAVARIMLPASYVRLSAGRENMSEEGQALCFLAGANSIFFGETLLTTPNPQQQKDLALLGRLGLAVEGAEADSSAKKVA